MGYSISQAGVLMYLRFADVHYYFSEPTPRPPAHRFDKGSYLYFYGNKKGGGGRIEIANNVGKPEQDAFTGCKWSSLPLQLHRRFMTEPLTAMESSTVRQSHKHPTLCTVTVDGHGSPYEGTITPTQQPEHHWRLPNTDPRNEGKYLFRLHTLDIYFWTDEDANRFMSAVQNKLDPTQVQILDTPRAPAAHKEAMSPVVQQLENVAIQDPAYRNGQTRDSKIDPAGTAALSFGKRTQEETREEPLKAQDKAGFQPLAYNPAAPPAPEPIKHREKTPPPEDAESGTGLAGAAYRDHAQAISPQRSMSRSLFSQPQIAHGNLTPQPSQIQPSSYGSPPPLAQGQRTSNVSSFSPPPPQDDRGSSSPYTPISGFAAPPSNPQRTASPDSHQLTTKFNPPPHESSAAPFYNEFSDPQESPATEILGNSYVSGHRQPLQHLQPQYADYTPTPEKAEPHGGYSNYQYTQQHTDAGRHTQSNEYDIHSQVYRPTKEEASKHKPSKTSATTSSPTGRLEQGAGKVDKKVNRFFKNLEKKIG